MNAPRILVLVLLLAVIAFGLFWMTSSDPQGELEQVGEGLPSVEMGTGTTTVPVPTDADIVTREREIDGETYEYPAVDVQTEEREIEYPTVEVTPAEENADDTADVEPVMEDPNDPVPPVDVDIDEDGDITATQPAE